MIKPIDLKMLVKKPVSEYQKHIVNQFRNNDEYKNDVILNSGKILYSPCGMFVYLYNENTERIFLIFELGAFN